MHRNHESGITNAKQSDFHVKFGKAPSNNGINIKLVKAVGH